MLRPIVALAVLLAPSLAHAEGWSDAAPRARADVRAGRPLVSLVIVPLCDNALINCGSSIAGKPSDLAHNVYWGATFGQRRYFERKNSGWERVAVVDLKGDAKRLERAIFRRTISLAPWGGPADATTDHYVVLDAYDGRAIDAAVVDLFRVASRGATVRIPDRGELPVHVVGYAGHNRLMDHVATPSVARSSSPLPSFVMACESSRWFDGPLAGAGSPTLVMTRTLMAPEGYVVEAISRALGENASPRDLRASAVRAYAKWQRLTPASAGSVFQSPSEHPP